MTTIDKSEQQYRVLTEALRFLAGHCDGAKKRDDAGFNGRDAQVGHSFAEQLVRGRVLTARQQHVAIRMVQKYRNTQLGHLDIPQVDGFEPYDPTVPVWYTGTAKSERNGHEVPCVFRKAEDGKYAVALCNETGPYMAFVCSLDYMKTHAKSDRSPAGEWVPAEMRVRRMAEAQLGIYFGFAAEQRDNALRVVAETLRGEKVVAHVN